MKAARASRWILLGLVPLFLTACPEFVPEDNPPPRDLVHTAPSSGQQAKGSLTFVHIYEVYVVRSNGTALRRVTNNSRTDASPTLLDRGSPLYYVCGRGAICSSNVTGGETVVYSVGQDRNAKFSSIDSIGVGPDGKKIAISARGEREGDGTDLYVLDLATGGITRVHNDDARDFSEVDPVWTPSGGLVWSDNGGGIFVKLPSDAQPRRLELPAGEAYDPSVSPDGTRIAVAIQESSVNDSGQLFASGDVWTVGIDGSNPTNVTNTPGEDEAIEKRPAWSPDGTEIAFITSGADARISAIKPDGTGRRDILVTEDTLGTTLHDSTGVWLDWGDLAPAVSVSDLRITEGENGGFTVSLSEPADGQVTVRYEVSDGTARAPDDYDPKAPDVVTFAPGETTKTVTVSSNEDDVVETTESFYLRLVNPSGAILGDSSGRGLIRDDDQPTPSPTPSSPSPTTSPSPSPTASPAVSPGRIVFVSATDAGFNQLFTMKADGSDVQHISTNQASSNLDDPSWSSDGTKIIHTALDGSQHELITRLAAPGGAFDPILHPSDDVEPAFRGGSTTEYWWSSNEHGDYDLFRGPGRNHMTTSASDERDVSFGNDPLKFVYEANYDGDYDIYLQELATSGANLAGSPQNLTQETGGTTANDVDPDLSADGTKVAFSRNGDIYVVNVATKVLIRVTSDAAAETDPTFSPDGHQIAFVRQVGTDTEIFRISASGGTAVNISNNPTGIDESPDWGPASSSPRPVPTGSTALTVGVPLGLTFGVGLERARRRRSR